VENRRTTAVLMETGLRGAKQGKVQQCGGDGLQARGNSSLACGEPHALSALVPCHLPPCPSSVAFKAQSPSLSPADPGVAEKFVERWFPLIAGGLVILLLLVAPRLGRSAVGPWHGRDGGENLQPPATAAYSGLWAGAFRVAVRRPAARVAVCFMRSSLPSARSLPSIPEQVAELAGHAAAALGSPD